MIHWVRQALSLRMFMNRTKPRFVVQEHHARHLHYDLRLEMAGVLKSWAIPKGPSLNPAEKRLAVMVDDHSLAYLDFEGMIPPGQYGAGAVIAWDAGSYHLLEGDDPARAVEAGKLTIGLWGKILKGGFTLFRMRPRDDKNWLLVKKRDPYSRTDWRLEPALTDEKKRTLRERTPSCRAHRCTELGLPMR